MVADLCFVHCVCVSVLSFSCLLFVRSGIALSEANRMNLALPGLALAQQLYVSVQALGAGRQATTALTLALEAMNGIQAKKTENK